MPVVFGTNNDDLLVGTADNETFVGGFGNDTISGGDGNDGFFGGAGNDSLSGDAGDDTLLGDGGNDVLDGGLGNDTLYGGLDDDVLNGGEGINTLFGEGGHDRFVKTFGLGTDVIDGGTGVDTLDLVFTSGQLTGSVLAELGQLGDWLANGLVSVNGDVNLLSTAQDGAAVTLSGLGLTVSNVEYINVTIDGVQTDLLTFLNRDLLFGGGISNFRAGFDYVINGTAADDQLTGTDFADYIVTGEGRNSVSAGNGNDEIHGGSQRDQLFGNWGDDTIYGGGGNDTLVGSFGRDRLFGGDGNDGFFGGSDDDELYGEAGDDGLYGDAGNDVIHGGAGVNYLNGGSGDDQLFHQVGSTNTIVGGVGRDKVIVELASVQLTAGVRSELIGLRDWTGTGQGTATFTELGITVSEVEELAVMVDGQEVAVDDLVNRAPEVVGQVQAATMEDIQVTGRVEATDANGDSLSYAVATGPTNGSVTVDGATGAYVYTPNGNFSGTDTFSIVVSDGAGGSAVQEVVVSVAPVADAAALTVQDASVTVALPAPVMGTDGADVLVGDEAVSAVVPLDIAAALTDTDGSESLLVTVAGLPMGATLSAGTMNSDGSVTLTPDQLTGLTVAVRSAGSFDLQVTATTFDGGVSETPVVDTLTVTVDTVQEISVTLDGLGGDDTLLGSTGGDVLIGNLGNDFVDGGAGDDTFVGGAGNDVYVGGAGNDVVDYSQHNGGVVVDLGNGVATGAGTDTLSGIEGVIGSDFGDRIFGDAGDNVIMDGAGNDRSYGGAGSDTLIDGAGNDRSYGDEGSDLVVAGAGNDQYDGGDGIDVLSFASAGAGVNVDMDKGRASGSATGNDRFDSFEAVVGSEFDDEIVGSDAGDEIDGAGGDDLISGGEGADILTGGAGADVFVWDDRDLDDGVVDTITDFDAAMDVLDFSALDYQGKGGPSDAERMVLTETDGGTLVSVDMDRAPGETDVVFLDGVTGLSGTDWFTF